MNRTVIALIAVSLGALLPVPTAQGSTTACTQVTIENAKGLASDLVQVELLAPVEPCVTLCDTTATMQAAGSLDCGIPALTLCPRGSYGLQFDGEGKCLTPEPLPQPGPICPEGCVPECLAELTSAAALAYQVSACDSEPKDEGEPRGPQCDDEDRDWGTGGTHADCKYSCPEFSELAIRVEAKDDDAKVRGTTDCGGTQAWCNLPTYVCVGVSPHPTLRRDNDQICNGFSEEKIDSEVYIACIAVSVESDPEEVLCTIIECEPNSFNSVMAACLSAPGLAENLDVLLFALEGLDGRTINSLVSSHQTLDGTFAVRFDAASVHSDAACTTQMVSRP